MEPLFAIPKTMGLRGWLTVAQLIILFWRG